MRIAIGADHAGYALKAEVFGWLGAAGHEVVDLGTSSATAAVDYPDVAHALAKLVESAQVELGVLVCGSGVGMSIAVNRHSAVRAVVCSEPYSARLARQHNDANVLCLGARVIGSGTAKDIVDAFFGMSFEGGRHAARVAKINP
jgi:ribose 5-phosphate isomerase B